MLNKLCLHPHSNMEQTKILPSPSTALSFSLMHSWMALQVIQVLSSYRNRPSLTCRTKRSIFRSDPLVSLLTSASRSLSNTLKKKKSVWLFTCMALKRFHKRKGSLKQSVTYVVCKHPLWLWFAGTEEKQKQNRRSIICSGYCVTPWFVYTFASSNYSWGSKIIV